VDYHLLAYVAAIVATGAALFRLARGAGTSTWWLILGVAQVAVIGAIVRGLLPDRSPVAGGPTTAQFDGYVSSDACASCHPGQYSSWHRSYHRTMTRQAQAATILAPWEGNSLRWRGRTYELFKKGNRFWTRLPDPSLAAAAGRNGQSAADVPSVEREVLMVTGSHHYQAYWVAGARGNELYQFPFVYHFESARFIPRHDAFLQPEDAPEHHARWNSNCIMCHSVAGQPRHDPTRDVFETRVAELGIACEACHGPGAQHVAHHKNPVARYRQRMRDQPDPTIVNPARFRAPRP
jgi:hypothetical protein